MGYSQWQVGKDSDFDVNTSFNSKDQIHAAGGQIGLRYTPGTRLFSFMGYRNFELKPGLKVSGLR